MKHILDPLGRASRRRPRECVVKEGEELAVVGLLERKGKVFTKSVDRCTKEDLLHVILSKVKGGVDVFTDGWPSYDGLAVYGFNHKKVKHEREEFSNGNGSHIKELRRLIRKNRRRE